MENLVLVGPEVRYWDIPMLILRSTTMLPTATCIIGISRCPPMLHIGDIQHIFRIISQQRPFLLAWGCTTGSMSPGFPYIALRIDDIVHMTIEMAYTFANASLGYSSSRSCFTRASSRYSSNDIRRSMIPPGVSSITRLATVCRKVWS